MFYFEKVWPKLKKKQTKNMNFKFQPNWNIQTYTKIGYIQFLAIKEKKTARN